MFIIRIMLPFNSGSEFDNTNAIIFFMNKAVQQTYSLK